MVPVPHSYILLVMFLSMLPPLIAMITCGVVAWVGVIFIEHRPDIQTFSNAWSLGPLGILKIPPVGYSYQGFENLVSRSLRFKPCAIYSSIDLPSPTVANFCWRGSASCELVPATSLRSSLTSRSGDVKLPLQR